MRGPLEGMWLKDVRGWRLTLRNSSGAVLQTLDHTAPGRVLEPIRVSLDSIGTLETLSFDWKGRFDYDPSSLTALLEVLDAVHGWQEVCEGWLEQPRSRRKRSSPQFANFYKLVEGDFYEGSLPPIRSSLGISALNFLGGGIPALDSNTRGQINSSVLQKTFETLSDASVGTDAQRRMILARPGVGSPVRVKATQLLDWDIGDWETPNYITRWRATPGPGWASFEGGNSRGSLVPERVRTAGAEFSEVTSSSGMPLLWAVIARTGGNDDLDFKPLPSNVTTGFSVTFEAEDDFLPSRCVYLGYDPAAWYQQSALIPNNLSDYEPLTAYLRIGVTLLDLETPSYLHPGLYIPFAVVLDEAIWISSERQPDLLAVSPGALFVGGLDPSPIHPQYLVSTNNPDKPQETTLNSSLKAILRQKPRSRLYYEDIGKTQYIDYPIPEALFRQNQDAEYGPSWALHIALGHTLERTYGNFAGASCTVRYDFEKVLFGKKIAAPVDTGQGLAVPYTEGPACVGEARGALLSPAVIEGLEIRDGILTNQNVVSVDLEITGKRTTSKITTGTLPYRS